MRHGSPVESLTHLKQKLLSIASSIEFEQIGYSHPTKSKTARRSTPTGPFGRHIIDRRVRLHRQLPTPTRSHMLDIQHNHGVCRGSSVLVSSILVSALLGYTEEVGSPH